MYMRGKLFLINVPFIIRSRIIYHAPSQFRFSCGLGLRGINFLHYSSPQNRIFKPSPLASLRANLYLTFIAVLIGLTGPLCGEGKAGNTATQTIRFQMLGVNEIAVSGSPALLIAEKGNPLKSEASDRSTTYSISTNLSNQKITGKIDAPMPAGVNLTVNMAPLVGQAARAMSFYRMPTRTW